MIRTKAIITILALTYTINKHCNNWKKISEFSSQTIVKHKNKLTPNEKWTFSVNGANALPLQHGKETNIITVVGIQRKRGYEGIYYHIMQSNMHFHTS